MKIETASLIRFDISAARTRFQSADGVDGIGEDDDGAWCSRGSKRQLRVLVADDCRDTADSLSMLAQIWGHKV